MYIEDFKEGMMIAFLGVSVVLEIIIIYYITK